MSLAAPDPLVKPVAPLSLLMRILRFMSYVLTARQETLSPYTQHMRPKNDV